MQRHSIWAYVPFDMNKERSRTMSSSSLDNALEQLSCHLKNCTSSHISFTIHNPYPLSISAITFTHPYPPPQPKIIAAPPSLTCTNSTAATAHSDGQFQLHT
eukprot:scaffold50301_cov63-Cyclotella_meneghiniana.AAC.2